MKVQLNSLEIRILSILKDWYPITVEELRDELSLRPAELDRALKSLMVKGIIVLEPLSDKSYIRLLAPDIEIEFAGGKRKKPRPKDAEHPPEDDSIMYR